MTDINAKIAELCDTPDPVTEKSWKQLAIETISMQNGIIEELLIENRRLQAEIKSSVDGETSADGEVD